jgi:hypothetical protein
MQALARKRWTERRKKLGLPSPEEVEEGRG